MSSKFTSRFVKSRVRVFAHLTQAMSQKKEKGNRLDSIPRLGKQVWRRANVKGTRRKLLEDRITEVLRLASGENGDDEVGYKLEDESAVHCPSAQAGSYSANWRMFSKVGDIVLFAGPTNPSMDHFHGNHGEGLSSDSDGMCSYISYIMNK